MNTENTLLLNDGMVKLKNMQLKYKDFITKFKELFANHRLHIDQLETLLKQVEIDPLALKNVNIITMPFADWKVHWEGTMRFSQVLGITLGKTVRGEYVDLKTLFTKDILSTIGIEDFSYISQGKLMYSKIQVIQNEKYLAKSMSESRSIQDWDKITYLNQRLSVNRMLDLMKLIFWDDLLKTINNTIDYISSNLKKEEDTKNSIDRFYMCLFLMEFGIIFYEEVQKLMLCYITLGTTLVESRKNKVSK